MYRKVRTRIPILTIAAVVFVATSGIHEDDPFADEGRTSTLTPAARLIDSPRVLVIAHRGDSAHAPENTLPAFRSAIRTGADLIELDYYHSADTVPIVFHDKVLDRTTNAKLVLRREKVAVGSLTLEQLRNLDAGAWFDAQFRDTRIPTLEEALEVIQSGSTTLIERKGGDASTCVAILRRKNLLANVVVQSFDWSYVRSCHQMAPELVLAALGDKELTATRLDQMVASGARIVGWKEKDVRESDIREIHRRGLRLWVYTVNDVARAQQLVAQGVDGIITDDPGAIRRVLSR